MLARVSIVAIALSLCGVGAWLMPAGAIAQQQTVNPKMGPPLKAALEAAQRKQFDVAMAKIKEAEAEKKTAFEQFKIYETLSFIYYGQKKYAEAANAYEKQLDTPQFLSAEQKANFPKTIAQLYAAANQHAKVIEYGKRWLQDRPNDTEMLGLVGAAHYNLKEHKACLQTFVAAISAAEKAGGKPQEGWLQYARNCAAAAGEGAAEANVIEKTVRYYPRPEIWQTYIRRMSGNDRNPVAVFNWYRLMHETNAFKTADDYTTFASLAMTEFNLPCEALKAMEEGFQKKILGVAERDKARHTNTLNKAKEAATAAKARLAQLLAEAEADATGQKYIEAASIEAACGQSDQAVAHYQKGLKLGGGKEPANAKLALGIAQYRRGDRDGARATFRSLDEDPVLGKVASAWILRTYN